MRKITILIPAYNEAPNLPALLSELEKLTAGTLPDVQLPPDAKPMTDYEWEFLFVDDGSRDDTLQILLDARRHDPRINIVALSRNFGKERAMLAGMDMARGDALVIIDADLQHPLRYIPEMVYWWDCKGYDDVYARRDIRGRESIWRKGLTSVFYKILHSDSGVEMLFPAWAISDCSTERLSTPSVPCARARDIQKDSTAGWDTRRRRSPITWLTDIWGNPPSPSSGC